ncbi:gamma-interferon-inducible lysosomal thiol reductase-like [Cydia splendana]|uniref:gamma-interferon-inducible lysosomal thiol reductase-like n=1 Tax=Cydia splendana TaxID=1100963 RepID=UPI00300C1DB2
MGVADYEPSYKRLNGRKARSSQPPYTILPNEADYEADYKIEKTDKVDLRVYYCCLCGGCVHFHIKELDPTYKKIGSYIDLKNYPYGLTSRWKDHGKIIFDCPGAHGPEECYGNKLHACAIDILKNVSQSEFYNSCMMNSTWGGEGSTDKDAINCGKLMKIDSKPIIECANSERSDALMEYYGIETDKVTNPNKKHMPLILLNGKEFNRAKDLMKTICQTLAKPPPECKSYF